MKEKFMFHSLPCALKNESASPLNESIIWFARFESRVVKMRPGYVIRAVSRSQCAIHISD
jgi:hypothetical protein